MNPKFFLALITGSATILGNLFFGLMSGSYTVGSNVARIDARLESLNQKLETRDRFLNYRVDNLKLEIDKLKEGK